MGISKDTREDIGRISTNLQRLKSAIDLNKLLHLKNNLAPKFPEIQVAIDKINEAEICEREMPVEKIA